MTKNMGERGIYRIWPLAFRGQEEAVGPGCQLPLPAAGTGSPSYIRAARAAGAAEIRESVRERRRFHPGRRAEPAAGMSAKVGRVGAQRALSKSLGRG